ncbi:uncharacterized protein LOC144019232 [Festucalex cinctus]
MMRNQPFFSSHRLFHFFFLCGTGMNTDRQTDRQTYSRGLAKSIRSTQLGFMKDYAGSFLFPLLSTLFRLHLGGSAEDVPGCKTTGPAPRLYRSLPSSLKISQVACGARHTLLALQDVRGAACGNKDYGQIGSASADNVIILCGGFGPRDSGQLWGQPQSCKTDGENVFTCGMGQEGQLEVGEKCLKCRLLAYSAIPNLPKSLRCKRETATVQLSQVNSASGLQWKTSTVVHPPQINCLQLKF